MARTSNSVKESTLSSRRLPKVGQEGGVTATAAKKARKAKAAAKADPAVNGTLVAKFAPAKGAASAVAILRDGSTHALPSGVAIGTAQEKELIGQEWSVVKTRLLAAAREAAAAAGKQPAQLARGVDSRNAPQSAKAVADQKRSAKPAAAAAKAEKKAARKAERAAKAAPKADDARKITIVDRKFTFGGDGTARRQCWDACVATAKAKGTVADYIARGGKAKYLPRWAASGAIKLG